MQQKWSVFELKKGSGEKKRRGRPWKSHPEYKEIHKLLFCVLLRQEQFICSSRMRGKKNRIPTQWNSHSSQNKAKNSQISHSCPIAPAHTKNTWVQPQPCPHHALLRYIKKNQHASYVPIGLEPWAVRSFVVAWDHHGFSLRRCCSVITLSTWPIYGECHVHTCSQPHTRKVKNETPAPPSPYLGCNPHHY